MPGDPFRIFAETPNKQETLKVVWPALYECLAKIGAHAGPPPVINCVIGECATGEARRKRVPAAGRLTPNGHPACETHLALAEIPGGYPLKRITLDEADFHRKEARAGR